MFREMRRKNQMLSNKECICMLKQATSGTLALHGDNGYPYAVPMSYVYHDGKIYFHSALTGHKISAIKQNNKASFCIIYKDDVVPEKFTTCFQSVIVFGKINIIDDISEKKNAIEILAAKYSPDIDSESEIKNGFERMHMIKLDIEHMTGKEGIELARMRK